MSFLYWSLRRLLELIVLRFRSEREKEIEILLLRHQLLVLERQVARPELSQADRALLAAFRHMLAGDPAAAEEQLRARCDGLETRGERGFLSASRVFARTLSTRSASTSSPPARDYPQAPRGLG